jgi:glycosyltransferase involved in cell wall biosynthesis
LVRFVQAAVLGTIGRWVLDRADAIVVIDAPIAEHTLRALRGAGRVRVLGNGVDTGRFRPATAEERRAGRAALGLPADLPLLLFVGRFVPKKGFPWVAAAAGDDYRIVFAGGARPAGVTDDRLVFLGAVPYDDIPAVYRSVDAVVVASVGECPMTVLEGMSSGLPLLLNEDPALHSPWTSGPGVRFVDMSSGELPSAVKALLSDVDLARKRGAEARVHVLDRFSWEVHLDQLETLYDEVRVPGSS